MKRKIISLLIIMVMVVSSASLASAETKKCWDAETVPHYNQKEKPWAPLPYWAKTVERRGCGPCSMASAVCGITGKTVTPKNLLNSRANGLSTPMLNYVKAHYGIKYKPIPKTVKSYTDTLKSGRMIWVTIRGTCKSGPWKTTVKGHYILLYGYKDGKCKIMDSNGPEGASVAGKYCISIKDAAAWTQSSVGPIALWGKRVVSHKWKFKKYTGRSSKSHTKIMVCTKCGKTKKKVVKHDHSNTELIAEKPSLYYSITQNIKSTLPEGTSRVYIIRDTVVATAKEGLEDYSWDALAKAKYLQETGEPVEGWTFKNTVGWNDSLIVYNEETDTCTITTPYRKQTQDISDCTLLKRVLKTYRCKQCKYEWKKRE